MGKSKTRVPALLAALTGGLLMLGLLRAETLRFRAALQAAGEYRDRIEHTAPVTREALAELEAQLLTLRQKTKEQPVASEVPPAEALPRVRGLLKSHGLLPERIRINGTGREESAEFTLRGAPVDFFRFLAEASQEAAVVFSYISLRPTPGVPEADITLRMRHE
jgi:hypothetical protein